MADPRLPVGEGDVPDKVLEELLAAFASDDFATAQPSTQGAPASEPSDADAIDLDAPSIDALLGITSETAATAHDSAVDSDADADADVSDEVITTRTPVTGPSAEPANQATVGEPALDLAAGLTTAPVPETPVAGESGQHVQPGSTIDAGSTPPVEPRKPIQIGGGDDDLIDAVYLDEEGADRLRGDSSRQTEASMERTTILIGDDEIEGSSGGIPIATGPNSMDPRLRARRIAVKRAVGRRRLKWFVVGGVVVVLITAVLAVLGSSLFEVQNISPSGVSANTKASYDVAADKLLGHPVLLVDTNAIESELEKNPWIREARVTTDFPDGASIEIVERVPLATYQGADGRWRIIDVDGVVLTVIDGQPLAFMRIDGRGAEAEAGGSAGDAFRHAAELVEALSPAARSRTEAVVVGDTGELSLRFESGEVILGAPANLLDKLTRLEAVLKNADTATCSVINVSSPEIGLSDDC